MDLKQVTRIPFDSEAVEDRVFKEFRDAGDEAIPCLIAQLTNTQRMHDPRPEPVVSDFRVGDLAFFMLLKATDADYDRILPRSVALASRTDGVDAYFKFVQRSKNRERLQRRWCVWTSKKMTSNPQALEVCSK